MTALIEATVARLLTSGEPDRRGMSSRFGQRSVRCECCEGCEGCADCSDGRLRNGNDHARLDTHPVAVGEGVAVAAVGIVDELRVVLVFVGAVMVPVENTACDNPSRPSSRFGRRGTVGPARTERMTNDAS